ncbi:MAG: hypothetical protein ACI9N9_002795 [Enterobacterales bacterium]|jgi:hypothetical protein
MFKTILISSLAFLFLAACATRPEGITAQYVSHEKYIDLNCTELNTQLVDARSQLTEFSNRQDTKANVDAGGVFLALIPVSAFTGDYEGDVARWKGEIQAIETAQIKNKCKSL